MVVMVKSILKGTTKGIHGDGDADDAEDDADGDDVSGVAGCADTQSGRAPGCP